jgi:hypothetical protein
MLNYILICKTLVFSCANIQILCKHNTKERLDIPHLPYLQCSHMLSKTVTGYDHSPHLSPTRLFL